MQVGAMGRQSAADYLGVSLRTLDYVVKRGELPRVMIGRKPVFRVVDLDAYLESRLESVGK